MRFTAQKSFNNGILQYTEGEIYEGPDDIVGGFVLMGLAIPVADYSRIASPWSARSTTPPVVPPGIAATILGEGGAAAVAAEAAARAQADAQETSARQQADNVEREARIAADTAETAARQAADTAEATARANADTSIQASISAEVTARSNADASLTTAINNEISNRTAAVSAEASARAAADANLQSQINALSPSGAPIAIDGIDPDSQVGADDRAKFIAACTAAVAAGKPVVLKRFFTLQKRVQLTEAFDGLEIVGFGSSSGLRMSGTPDTSDTAWAWMLHIDPQANQRMTVTLRNFKVDGNRGNLGVISALTSTGTTQWGISIDGGGYAGRTTPGYAEVYLHDMIVESHDQSGLVVIGDEARVKVDGLTLRFMGLSGLDVTRGRFDGNRVDSGWNAGVQINLSSGYESKLTNSRAHNGGRTHRSGKAYKGINQTAIGGGIKISLRPDASNPPVRAFLDAVHIEDCVGLGLSSTSAGTAGLFHGGSVVIRRCGGGGINLTDGCNIMLDSLETKDNLIRYSGGEIIATLSQAAIDSSSTDILIYHNNSAQRAYFGRLRSDCALGHNLNGGYGCRFNARVAEFINSAGASYNYVRWQDASASFRVDQISYSGTASAAFFSGLTQVIGTTY